MPKERLNCSLLWQQKITFNVGDKYTYNSSVYISTTLNVMLFLRFQLRTSCVITETCSYWFLYFSVSPSISQCFLPWVKFILGTNEKKTQKSRGLPLLHDLISNFSPSQRRTHHKCSYRISLVRRWVPHPTTWQTGLYRTCRQSKRWGIFGAKPENGGWFKCSDLLLQ